MPAIFFEVLSMFSIFLYSANLDVESLDLTRILELHRLYHHFALLIPQSRQQSECKRFTEYKNFIARMEL